MRARRQGVESMAAVEERFLIYTALLVLCATSGAFLGPVAALCTFVQVAAIIELVYWFAFRVVGSYPTGGER